MTSAELVINTLKDLRGREEYNRYDENLCADIKKRLDGKLNEKNLGITEKTIFVSVSKDIIIITKIDL